MAIGSTLRPELGRMDFSGIERGGRAAAEAIMRGSERLGRGIASAGASIGGALKERGEMKTAISSAQKMAEGLKSIEGINPEAIQILDSMKSGFADEELPLSQRANAAKQFLGSASQVINLGVMRAFEKPKPPSQAEQYLNAVEAINTGGFGAVAEDETPVYNRQEAVQAYLDSGGTDMKAFESAETQMINEGVITTPEVELKTQDIEGTNYVAIFQPSGSVSVIPKGKELSKEAELSDEQKYNQRKQSIDSALESGILNKEQYKSALQNLGAEIYGFTPSSPFLNLLEGSSQDQGQSNQPNTNPLDLDLLQNGR